ncbi:MAG: tetratricopeptide repeat protein [Bacteroidetes bacterium]|nr:tetratricopeptide repeat protein [Bacteroidota bacterium]
MQKQLLFFICFTVLNCIYAQTPKKYFSSGEKFQELKNYKDAAESYSQAIKLDPTYEKAYPERAFCYEMLGERTKAIEDYKVLVGFDPKKKEYYYKMGKLYFELNSLAYAEQSTKQALALDDDYLEATLIIIQVLHKQKKYLDALKYSEKALEIKKAGSTYFYHALTLDSLKSYPEAEKEYKNAKYYDSKLVMAYVGLANVQVKLNKKDEALKFCDEGLTKNPSNNEILWARSSVYASKGDYSSAVNDITKVIVSTTNNIPAYLLRADYYIKQGQYQSAINDYSKCINIDNSNMQAYFNRAHCFEQIGALKEAVKDYERIKLLSPNNEGAVALMKEVKNKLFEFNRETEKPDIAIISPRCEGRNIKIASNLTEFTLKGTVKDASPIRSILVNSIKPEYVSDTVNAQFEILLKAESCMKELVVEAEDVYGNKQKIVYSVQLTEINKPAIALIAPYSSFDNEVFLDNTNSDLYIEGRVKDESPIESIVVDGIAASFPLQGIDPVFSTKINIANKNNFTVMAKDIYGNTTVEQYKLNREGANALADNPMGTTWVVFIENSKYESFVSLEGPEKDVTLMKSSLANYKVSKIIHKKDMTKTQLEKFFSIELRDLVRSNNVNSLLVWYAGHGKFVSQTGYWIPVDAKVDDEFTYYNIGNVKTAMQSYSTVTHKLVITDACESGPTFVLAMRGDAKEEKRCDDKGDTKFKSAQVLTSAGFELAADNSQFTKVFTNSLNNNSDACISIDRIAKKIKEVFQQTGRQEPKFGKIKDVDDEGGTYFFIKK